MELKKQSTAKSAELESKIQELEKRRHNHQVAADVASVFIALLQGIPYVGMAIGRVGEIIIDQYVERPATIEEKIKKTETEINKNFEILKETVKNQQKFDYKLTPLLAKLDEAINQSNLSDGNKTQIGLEISRYKLLNIFKEFIRLLKEITLDSIEEVRLTVSQLEYAIEMILDISDRVHTYNQQSELAVYLNAIDADHRDSIRKLLAGNEVVFSSEVTKSDNLRMAVKFKEIGIAIRTHMAENQSELNTVLDGYEITMKHMGFSYYRWHDEFYVIASDTHVLITKSFRECYNGTNLCSANEAYYKLKNGNAFLSPYTMWTLKLHCSATNPMKSYDRLQRFVGQVDIELEGTGTYVDQDIQLDRNQINNYYRKLNVNNNVDPAKLTALQRCMQKKSMIV